MTWTRFLRWAPVALWMAIIFSASSDSHSWQHSSKIIGPFIRWLFPHLSDHQFGAAVFFVRKCAHVTEYAILALLLWRAFSPVHSTDPVLRVRIAWRCLAVVALYAATDEFHQHFVPTREASVVDVLIDTSGAAFALGILWFTSRWQKRAG